jgi:hypothetical protein
MMMARTPSLKASSRFFSMNQDTLIRFKLSRTIGAMVATETLRPLFRHRPRPTAGLALLRLPATVTSELRLM